MIEISAPSYDDESYDSCGNSVHAILHVDKIKIPLCENCLSELRDSLKEYDSIVFCHQCKHFGMSTSGWSYGGSCKKDNPNLDSSEYGYVNCKDCTDTCQFAEHK